MPKMGSVGETGSFSENSLNASLKVALMLLRRRVGPAAGDRGGGARLENDAACGSLLPSAA
jgi:hypothetical protein